MKGPVEAISGIVPLVLPSTAITARFRTFAVAAALLAAAAGCSGGGTAPDAVSAAAGTYTLVTINGSALPLLTVPSGLNANCTGFADAGTLVLTSGSYDLKLNAHFICQDPPTNFVVGGQVGTWSESGDQITFVPGLSSQNIALNLSAGTVNGSTLTVAMDLPSYAPSGVGAGRANTEWRKQ